MVSFDMVSVYGIFTDIPPRAFYNTQVIILQEAFCVLWIFFPFGSGDRRLISFEIKIFIKFTFGLKSKKNANVSTNVSISKFLYGCIACYTFSENRFPLPIEQCMA